MKSKKPKFKITGMNAVYVCFAALIFIVLINLIKMRVDINNQREELEQIKLQCAEQTLENEELEAMLNGVGDEYFIRIAREELDFVFPGERVYKIRSGN